MTAMLDRDRILGATIGLLALVMSPEVLTLLLVSDGEVENQLWFKGLALVRIAMGAMSLALLWKLKLPSRRQTVLTATLFIPVALLVYGHGLRNAGTETPPPPRAVRQLLLCNKLEPALINLRWYLLNLNLPKRFLNYRFEPEILVDDEKIQPGPFIREKFLQLQYFEDVELRFLDGRFVDPAETEWQTTLWVQAEGRLSQGACFAYQAEMKVLWNRRTGHWKVEAIDTSSVQYQRFDEPWFRSVTFKTVFPLEALGQVQQNPYEEAVRRASITGGEVDVFMYLGVKRKPTLAVADVDNDGFDDLFLGRRTGPAVFLRNRGNGTFEDQSAPTGLNLEAPIFSALFVDIDNDGDLDLAVGGPRGVELHRNQNGVFQAPKENEVWTKPTTGIVAADLNQDGLSDLLASTFVARVSPTKTVNREPNLVLMNRGTHLELVDPLPKEPPSTLASLVFDANGDLRPDIYLLGQGSADELLIRDQDDRYLNSSPVGPMSAGRGLDSADIDGDLSPELLVSSPSFNRMAVARAGYNHRLKTGPQVLSNRGGQFEIRELPALERVDYSSGGQFCDLDRDGYSDIYLPTGLYTAPEGGKGNLSRSRRAPQRNQVFRNDGSGAFQNATGVSGLGHWGDARGFSKADFNNDGSPDLALCNLNRPSLDILYHREATPEALWVRLTGANSTPRPNSKLSSRKRHRGKDYRRAGKTQMGPRGQSRVRLRGTELILPTLLSRSRNGQPQGGLAVWR